MEAQNRPLYDLEHHDVYIASLRTDTNKNFNALTAARKSKLRYFSMAPHDFAEWLQDINKLASFGPRYSATIDFYESLVREYPVAANWYRYIGYVIENEHEWLGENGANGANGDETASVSVSGLFARALPVVNCDFEQAHLVYNQYFEYSTHNLQAGDSLKIDNLWKTWLSVLSVSHADLDNTFTQASSFVSKYYPNSYESHMLQANKVYQRSQKLASYYIKLEDAVKVANLPQPWCDYLDHIAKYADDASTRLPVTLARSRIDSEASGTAQWIPVWLSFLYGLYTLRLDTETHLYNFVRAFPNSAVSYGEYIRSCQGFADPELKFCSMLDRIEHIDLMNTASYDDWKVVALAVLFYEHKASPGIPGHLKAYVDHAFRHNDVFHAVEKLAVSIAVQKDDMKLASAVTTDLVRHFPDQCEVWLFAGQFQQAHGSSYMKVARLYRDAVMECSKMDWPERIIQEALNFELAHGTLESYNEMMLVANRELKKVLTSPEAVPPTEEEPQSKATEDKIPVRNRESLKIKVENIPKSATENDIKSVFSDCGEVGDFVLVDSGSQYEATVEFRTEQALMAALTKDKKAINGQHIAVSQLREAIVWVSNFPPSMSQSEVKALFEECGTIASARFPSLKSGRGRRFCYLEFTTPEAAAAAVKKLNGTKLNDKIGGGSFKLVVAISRPPKKNETRTQVMHRQVCVKNLDYFTTEPELRAVFEKHGELEEISLPLKKDMRDKGHANGGFAFVTFKNEPSALNALSADGELVRNRKIHVYRAQPQVSIYNPSDYDDQRTITITGFPDSVRQEQLQAFMAEHFGTVTKSFLDHENGSAVVEFSDSETTKSALQIESTIYDGNTLKVGPKASFRNPHRSTTSEPKRKLMVPTAVARKRKRTE